MRGRKPRRRCSGPDSRLLCATAPAGAGRDPRALLRTRVRCACRRREGFAGRGFGRERRREAR